MCIKKLIFLSLSCFLISNISNAQCNTAQMQSNNGGVIHCNFPALDASDIDYFTKRLNSVDSEVWATKKLEERQKRTFQWKTKNLRILLMTNSEDIISDAQIEKLKLAMNLHLVDIAKANNNPQLTWSQMPIVEEIIIKQYPTEFVELFGATGFLVFTDPDPRNGTTELSAFVKDLLLENKANVLINFMDSEIESPFTGAAQVYCNHPGEYMSIALEKNNTIALSDKYLVQMAIACVHGIGHTNFANHQEQLREEEKTNICHDKNHAQQGTSTSIMANSPANIKQRKKENGSYARSWSSTNANEIIQAYMQRGLLIPLFDFESPKQKKKENIDIEYVKIFPNPVNQILTIELENSVIYDLAIYNAAGSLINQKTLDSFITELDVSDYDAGTYILEFVCEDSGERIIKKLEKVN